MRAVSISRAAFGALSLLLLAGMPVLADGITADDVNGAEFGGPAKGDGKVSPSMIRAQVLLDRSRISPGVIDGHDGENVRDALKEFQSRNGLDATGRMDRQTWDRLAATSEDPALIRYEITQADVKGPFTPDIPDSIEDQAKLERLAYRGPKEELAERFHMDEDLLEALNPGKDFGKPGENIVVAGVRDAPPKDEKVARIVVDKASSSLRAYDDRGEVLAFYPATIGSEEKPAPSGTHEVRTVAQNPSWTYDPDFRFKGAGTDRKVVLKPGPNNPVGATWIDLDIETYGIHGTPEPSKIGKNASHGCVRLTNWDVGELAGLVRKGTAVEFGD